MMDLTNPSPDLGWGLRERRSITTRSEADVVLALVHRLAIGHNVPVPLIPEFLAQLGEHLIIEWVPKEDPIMQRLLAHRRDITPWRASPVAESARRLYRFRRLTEQARVS